MALVGDLILEPRLLGPPDQPQVLAAPAALTIGGTPPAISLQAAGGNTALPATQLFIKFTYTNPWGETLPSPEQSLTPSGSQVILFAGPVPFPASGINIYVGTATGAQNVRVSFTAAQIAANQAILQGVIGQNVGGYPLGFQIATPPAFNSAWLPDTDGAFAPASLVYGWLNSALREAAKLGGGIPDVTGAPSVVSQNTYTIPGVWRMFTDAWYDGYRIFLGSRNDNYYQSQIQTLAWNAIVQQWSSACQVEIFPQAQRTSGGGTLSSQMLATDTLANYTPNANGFSVPVGPMLVGTLGGPPGTYEIVTYTGFSTTQVTGLARGLGGTTPQTWPNGSNVYELNIRFSGRRYPRQNSVGDSALTVDIPAEWVDPVKQKILAKFKRAEHENQEAAELEQMFTAAMVQYSKANEIRTGRKQAGGIGGTPGVYFPSQFHGVIVN